eukprot:2832582-Rhodomonas_salina.2
MIEGSADQSRQTPSRTSRSCACRYRRCKHVCSCQDTASDAMSAGRDSSLPLVEKMAGGGGLARVNMPGLQTIERQRWASQSKCALREMSTRSQRWSNAASPCHRRAGAARESESFQCGPWATQCASWSRPTAWRSTDRTARGGAGIPLQPLSVITNAKSGNTNKNGPFVVANGKKRPTGLARVTCLPTICSDAKKEETQPRHKIYTSPRLMQAREQGNSGPWTQRTWAEPTSSQSARACR